MDNFHLNQTCEALQYLGGHSAQLLRIYTLEDWLFQVAIQVDIEHLCDDEIVLSEEKAVIDVDQLRVFLHRRSFKKFYFSEYFSFNLSIICIKFMALAEFNGDDLPVFFHVTTHEYLAKCSSPK